MSFIFVAIYTVSFEMSVNFSSWLLDHGGATKRTLILLFLSLIHYDFARHENLYNKMTS